MSAKIVATHDRAEQRAARRRSPEAAVDGVHAAAGVDAPAEKRHRQGDANLRTAALAFAVGSVIHNGDHFRRGLDSVSRELQAVGWLGMSVSLVAVVVVLSGHRTAPLVAVSAGFPLALGFIGAHWLPTWSALSDPFVEGGASWFSIVASLLEIGGALWLGVAGLMALRRRGGLGSVTG